MTARRFFIFDLDNCISNDEWRIRHIRWDERDPDLRYHDYHSLAAFDRPANMDVARPLIRTPAVRIAIFTARGELYRAATAHWLDAHSIRHDHLFMRPTGDHRSSVQLKAIQLALLKEREGLTISEHIAAAFDDRADVVEMYLRAGVPRASVLAVHDVCAYTPPVNARAG